MLKLKTFPIMKGRSSTIWISPVPVLRFHSKTTAGKSFLSYRDVIVFDHKFKLEEWLSRTQHLSLKHPSHNHILSRYATCEYHRPYNYNNIGEFSLNMAAGERKLTMSSHREICVDSVYHDVLIWPEGLLIKNLQNCDVSILYQYVFNEVSLENPTQLQSLKDSLSKNVVIEPLLKDNIQIIINVSKSYPLFRAKNVLDWFNESISKQQPSNQSYESASLQEKTVEFILGTELSEHRNATQVMILPFEDCFEGILSAQQVQKIVERYVRRLK